MIYYDLTYIDNNGQTQTTTIEYGNEPADPLQFQEDLREMLGYDANITVVFTREE